MLNHRDVLLPKNYSLTKLGDALCAEDIFALNQIPNVEINRKQHTNFSVNDLVLELGHFLDEEVVNRVELQVLSERIKKEWELPESFQLIETRNKEIGMTLNELEELAWRMAGQYDEKDIKSLEAMFSI